MVLRRVLGPSIETFDEDLRASWVPDVLAGVDAESRLSRADDAWATSVQTIEWLSVPKPDGTSFRAPLIPLHSLAVLNRAVEPLKDPADEVLAPTVCGYRRGAEPGAAYSAEHRRFTEIVRAEAAESAYVVSADVRRFFAATSWATVMRACARTLPTASKALLAEAVDGFQGAGLTHLPAGYADARFLANIVLVEADRAIGLPFARWVDDYRIFAPSAEAADAALGRLAEALADLGLTLNHAKARCQPAGEYIDSCGSSFTSVYHPESEAREVVRASLRTVFLSAAPDPRAHRRSLRFVLPRMAAEGDDIAVDWALHALATVPWEAPRLIAYLAAFAEHAAVRSRVEGHLLQALRLDDVWLAIRLAALACRTGIADEAADAVARTLRTTESPALWGVLLRAFALSGHREAVVNELRRRVLDPRAAVGACADLDLRGVLDFDEEMERTARALGGPTGAASVARHDPLAMSQGVDAASFEFYEGIRIFIPGALTVALISGAGATFGVASLNFSGKAVEGVLAALVIGLAYYFVDAPAKAAIIKPLQPTEYLRTWGVKPATHTRLNVYLLMLDTEIPASIRARALYMGSMYRIGFEAIYLLLLGSVAVFFLSAFRSVDADPNLSRDTAVHRFALIALVGAAWVFAYWRDRTGYSSKKEAHDVAPVRWSWKDGFLLLAIALGACVLMLQSENLRAWVFAVPSLLLTALWAYRYFRGYKAAGSARVPIDALHASLLAGAALVAVLLAQFATIPRLNPTEERAWGVVAVLSMIMIVSRGHERRLRGSYSSQNTWLAQNKEKVIAEYFTAPAATSQHPSAEATSAPDAPDSATGT